MPKLSQRPVVLCILDGWGYREETADNAPALAHTPNFDRFWASCPRGFLNACEEQVGLPAGQIGNSEVGHMNLGAGRVVYQDLPMIDRAIASGAFAANPALKAFIEKLQQSKGVAHVMGLASPGGVHAHQNHILEAVRVMRAAGLPVVIHAFLDGRDVPPKQAEATLPTFVAAVEKLGARLGTICGRYYAMDRDQRWDRVQQAYDCMVSAAGMRAASVRAALAASYASGKTDEFLLPVVCDDSQRMQDGDGLFFANFRADRAREILTALLDPSFSGFVREKQIRWAAALGMVEYSAALNPLIPAMFPPKQIADGFGEVLAKTGLTQLRIAETEKYPHVTFFFNGGEERVFPGEQRILVPSPKVATYDMQPEMSAAEVTDKVVTAVTSQQFDVVIINYANPDMVGHTGDLQAAIKACEAVDQGLGRLCEAVMQQGGVLFVTADHGNCELMRDPTTGGPHTAHTLNPVPAFLVNAPAGVRALRNGKLADVAPTLLALLGLPKPAAMDGKSLLQS